MQTNLDGNKPKRRSLPEAWRDLSPFLGKPRARFVALIAASIFSGLSEAAILLLVVRVALSLSSGEEAAVGDVTSVLFDVELSTSTMLLLAGGLALVRLIGEWAIAWLPAKISSGVQADLQRSMFEAYVRASWPGQAAGRDGHLQEVVTGQIRHAAQAVLFLATGVAMAFNLLALLGSALVVDPVASLLILMTAVGLFFAFRPLTQITKRHAAAKADATVELASSVTEAVSMSQEVAVYGVGPQVATGVRSRISTLAREYFKVQYYTHLMPAIYRTAALGLVIGGLGLLAAYASEDLAALGAIALILVRALTYSQGLQTVYHKVTTLAPYMDRVRTELEKFTGDAVADDGQPIDRIDSIEFDHVTFAYRTGEPVLHDLSLEVTRGQSIGIVGPSGAGKSTFVQLLLRLREPQVGRMLINGRPSDELSRADWNERVAFVPQDPRLVAGTVADNIRFYRSGITDEMVQRAAEMAHVHEDIMAWPLGYETPVGQRIDAVSGGQRQRLCLARALANRPHMLILDEPTSALDVKSESLVQESLAELRGELTLFIVAHRMSTLNVCDRILVLNDGVLDAFGSRDDLATTSPFFREALALSRLP